MKSRTMMRHTMHRQIARVRQSRTFFLALLLFGVFGQSWIVYSAQSPPNKITFENHSGQNAVVKLIGPTKAVVSLVRGQTRIVRVVAGDYHVLVRYGSSPKEYSYTKSAQFSVDQPENQISIITFTLHRRSGGSFQSEPVSGDEFEDITMSSLHPSDLHSPEQ
ncbi:MAG: hypothetical protein NPIRA04_09010 [Nitrospirales bacterium]|nr:MAG: hypothetical protein NPIRA04_09010 [Nitrospirales bacterium]